MTLRARVVVTGPSGLVGGATVDHVRRAGHRCTGIDVLGYRPAYGIASALARHGALPDDGLPTAC